jgi:hypothetical protein
MATTHSPRNMSTNVHGGPKIRMFSNLTLALPMYVKVSFISIIRL